MKKIKLFTLVQAVVLLSMSVPAQASGYPVSKFINQCRKVSNLENLDDGGNIDVAYCLGVMAGLRAANIALWTEKSKLAFCEPDDFSDGDLAEAFVMLSDKAMRRTDLSPALAAQVVLKDAFPCKYD